MAVLVSRSPADGKILGEVPLTPVEALSSIYLSARHAQTKWANSSLSSKVKFLLRLRNILAEKADSIIDIISSENGKPRFESLANEVLPSVQFITHFAKQSHTLLRNKPIPLNMMRHRKSYLQYYPYGTILVIAPWNYPFSIPFADIVLGVLAGNAVIFKPSEVTPLVGRAIQSLFDESGFPPGLVQTVQGSGALGEALIHQKPNKIFFTGSVPTGKKVMAMAAQHLIPVNLELGGKDSMIVLEDADLDYATSAALWGAYSNSGQVCASIERILVQKNIEKAFTQRLVQKISQLTDLGPITLEKQKAVYKEQLDEARREGGEFLAGGQFSHDQNYLEPTLIKGPQIEKLKVYQEETFGPVAALATFDTEDEAIEKANQSTYGLTAAVITKDLEKGERIAKQLQVGTAMINEVIYTAGLGETPWGGVKESGMGKTHSDIGFYEFTQIRHIHLPRRSYFTFKSLWWFPYSRYQYLVFREFLNLFRPGLVRKLSSTIRLIKYSFHFLKKEKRI